MIKTNNKIDNMLTKYFVKNQKDGENYSDMNRMQKIKFLWIIIGDRVKLREITRYVDNEKRAE